MTKLTYIVGNEEIISYETAKQKSLETNKPIISKYSPVSEFGKPDFKRLAKVQKYFAKMRREKRA